jgi:hypothetical protein
MLVLILLVGPYALFRVAVADVSEVPSSILRMGLGWVCCSIRVSRDSELIINGHTQVTESTHAHTFVQCSKAVTCSGYHHKQCSLTSCARMVEGLLRPEQWGMGYRGRVMSQEGVCRIPLRHCCCCFSLRLRMCIVVASSLLFKCTDDLPGRTQPESDFEELGSCDVCTTWPPLPPMPGRHIEGENCHFIFQVLTRRTEERAWHGMAPAVWFDSVHVYLDSELYTDSKLEIVGQYHEACL